MTSVIWVQFAKAPVRGRVKTRIAKTLGEHEALRIHKEISLAVNRQLLEGRRNSQDALWLSVGYAEQNDSVQDTFKELGFHFDSQHQQVDGNLGVKMRDAFEQATKKADCVFIVGSDFPVLDREYMFEAQSRLVNSDVVLAPTEDGGYGLIGVRTNDLPDLSDIEWGSDLAFEQTKQACQRHGLSVDVLETRFDVDTEEDYRHWCASRWRLNWEPLTPLVNTKM